jgi:hypothetical protein
VYCDYPGVFAADPGNAGYRAAWLAAVRARVLADGFDGVMLDDVNTFPGHCLGDRGIPIAEYATDEAYGDAVVGFLAAVGPELRDAGLAVAPNIAMNPWDEVQVAQTLAMLPHVTHQVREYWMRWNDSTNFGGDEWATTLETMRAAEAAGVGYLAIPYGPGDEGPTEGQRYGRASWLLARDGRADSAWGYWGDGEDPFGPDWGPDVGLPIGEAEAVDGAWRRPFAAGIVVVNPGEAAVTVPLGAAYVDADGGEVDTVTLAARTGRVLSR